MIVKKIITSNILHKVRQLESLSKTNLLAISCKPPQFGRTSTTLANSKQCLNSNVMNNGTKFSASGMVGLPLSRKASTFASDHAHIWLYEKLVSLALPFTIPAALIMENTALDLVMCILTVMHTHWGLEAIITDYARPIVVGTVLPKVLHILLFLLSASTLFGLIVLINDGRGVSRSIKDFWAIGKKPKESVADN